MSQRLGISTIMISSYELEKRQPSYSALIKLASFFGVTTDYLLGIENSGAKGCGWPCLNKLRFSAMAEWYSSSRMALKKRLSYKAQPLFFAPLHAIICEDAHPLRKNAHPSDILHTPL